MSDVERLTHDNHERRRWADEVEIQARENERRKQSAYLADRQIAVRRKTVRICYLVAGACAGATGILVADWLVRNARGSMLAGFVAAVVGLIFLWWAVKFDEEV